MFGIVWVYSMVMNTPSMILGPSTILLQPLVGRFHASDVYKISIFCQLCQRPDLDALCSTPHYLSDAILICGEEKTKTSLWLVPNKTHFPQLSKATQLVKRMSTSRKEQVVTVRRISGSVASLPPTTIFCQLPTFAQFCDLIHS